VTPRGFGVDGEDPSRRRAREEIKVLDDPFPRRPLDRRQRGRRERPHDAPAIQAEDAEGW
jgi:hypothetical protein